MSTIVSQLHVSAPGKVLMTGGYLVLIPPASGLVLSTTSRFHSWVTMSLLKEKHNEETIRNNTDSNPNEKPNTKRDSGDADDSTFITFTVHSPQFKRNFNYKLVITQEQIELKSEDSSKNHFIELPILYSILEWWKYPSIMKLTPGTLHIDITIEADNDYYSQSEERALTLEERILLPERKIPNVWPIQKTGLGSSAGLVTSLVAGIRASFKKYFINNIEQNLDHNSDDINSSLDLNTEIDVHRLAQFAHGLAQGKVGSGFDVSSAVYGSQRYVRFPPKSLQSIMDKTDPDSRICTKSFKVDLEQMLQDDQRWIYSRNRFSLPPGFNLFVADVKGGSETPGMVRKVLDWKANHPGADALWNHIDKLNQQLEEIFQKLYDIQSKHPEAYDTTLRLLSQYPIDQWNQDHEFTSESVNKELGVVIQEARRCFIEIRQSMKRMGQESDVEIEPDTQTFLLNETMKAAGCVFAGVPGAGGYDAIFSVYFGESRESIEAIWHRYGEENGLIISPLLLKESKHHGLFIENVDYTQNIQKS